MHCKDYCEMMLSLAKAELKAVNEELGKVTRYAEKNPKTEDGISARLLRDSAKARIRLIEARIENWESHLARIPTRAFVTAVK